MTTAPPQDIWLNALHHDGSGRYVRPLDGADPNRLRVGNRLRLRVRAGLDGHVQRLFLRTTPDGEQVFEELTEVAPGPACRWWEIDLRVSMPSTGYRFLVLTDDGHGWLNGSGVHRATPTDRDDFMVLAGHDPPAWLADRVFYQIVPDRFANGDPANDVPTGAWTYRGQSARRRAWDELPGRGPDALVEFFGGDLAGIEGRLDHVMDLGVNALYLTPVFETRSNHGYDTIDYERVADHFGGNEALVSLRQATAERGIRLMLDLAPNHVGVEHPWFLAAQAAIASRTAPADVADEAVPSAGYFVFHGGPDDYESWLGVKALPKLHYADPGLRAAMYSGPDAIMRLWLRPPFEIDGWRIDVANMLGRLGSDQLGPEVARGMRAAVKAENPDAYLLGEHSYDATDQLAGDQWDGVMNYSGFRAPVVEWLCGVELGSHRSGTILHTRRSSTEALVEALTSFRAAIAWSVARNQFNLLGSHDTARIATALGNDAGRIRAAFGLLLTYVGVPSILYGDEFGLLGENDLLARRPMPWDGRGIDAERFAFVRSLVSLRTSSAPLREGGFQVLELGADHLVYLRDTDTECAIVVIVRGPADRPAVALDVRPGGIPDGVRFTEHFAQATAMVTNGRLPLPALSAGVAVWLGSTAAEG
jgi:alpha-glucosidase